MEKARPINRICQTNLSKEEIEAFIMVYRRDKVSGKALPNRFEDWIQRECGIKNKQSAVIKNWVGWRAFLQSHLTAELIQRILLKILINYFQNSHTPWNHVSNCSCQDCNSYFTDTERTMTS